MVTFSAMAQTIEKELTTERLEDTGRQQDAGHLV